PLWSSAAMKPAPLLALVYWSSFMPISFNRKPTRSQSPPPFAPLGEIGPFGAQSRVVAVPWIDDGRIVVDVEHPAGHVAQQLLEIFFFPGFADTPGEQAVPGEQVGD